MNAPDMTLSEAERSSPAWLSMKAKFQARLEKLRLRNDDSTLTELETATLRGHLKCLREIISLDVVPPKVTTGRPMLAQKARTGSRS